MGIKGYKGFGAGMICRGMKFEVGKIYEEPEAKLCECGFHFCRNPLDVFRFYSPSNGNIFGEYAEIEALDEVYSDNDGIKSCTRKIKIVRALSIVDLVGEAVKKTDAAYTSTNKGDYSVATNTGYSSAATNTGDSSAATNTGYYSVATNTGNSSAATNAGYSSAATNTGYYSAATNTGDYSVATNTGDYSVATNSGKSSFAICTGMSGQAKGALGGYIALAEWEKQDGGRILKCFKSHKVDGKTIKPDVFYTLKNGKFVEVGTEVKKSE